MTTQRSQYQPFFAYLESLNFHFLDTWVIECVNYYKSINPDISVEVLKNEVKQQWLLVNLREIKVPSLPQDLKSKECLILNGIYAVQVESMIDSSESCYSQFQKVQKINTENVEATVDASEQNVKNRCLTFEICDGVQELQAMEYQPIKKIKTNDPELLPGFKMLIVGPVECRKGMILLKDENVRVCGGEVDTLAESNSLKSILIRRLDLDEADYLDNTSLNPAEDESEVPEPTPSVSVSEHNLDEGGVENLLSQNDDFFLTLPLEAEILQEEQKPQEAVNKNEEYETDMFSNDLMDWNVDNMNQAMNTSKNKKHSLAEEDIVTSTQKRLSLELASESSYAEPSRWNLTTSDYENTLESQPNTSTVMSQAKKPVQTKLSSFFKTGDFSLNTVSTTSSKPQKPLIVSGKPFVYLKQVLLNDFNQCNIFTIKGTILTLRKKITIENDEFNLKANITDGSASIDVNFSSGILEDLLSFSPSEMAVMMKARQGNTAVAQRIKEAFLKTQEKLISLNCLMKIKFFKDGFDPQVLELEEVTLDHLNALKERLMCNHFSKQC